HSAGSTATSVDDPRISSPKQSIPAMCHRQLPDVLERAVQIAVRRFMENCRTRPSRDWSPLTTWRLRIHQLAADRVQWPCSRLIGKVAAWRTMLESLPKSL